MDIAVEGQLVRPGGDRILRKQSGENERCRNKQQKIRPNSSGTRRDDIPERHEQGYIYESASAELGLLRGASSLSPDLRKLEAEFEGIRLELQRERIDLLFTNGLVRHELDREKARKIIWMYTGRDIYRMLVDESGWAADEYQDWLARKLADALMGNQRP